MPVKKDDELYVLLSEEDLHSIENPEQARAPSAPSPEAIAKRAFQRYLARGGSHGRDVEDWLASERELRGFF